MVCVRLPRPLADDEARALVAMIGPVKDPVGRTATGARLRYADDRQVIDSGFVMTDDLRDALGGGSLGGDDERPGLFEYFHTDDSYTDAPAAVTVLHARALPTSGGGATRFLDMRAASRPRLDPAERRRLEGLHAVHCYDNHDAFPPRASTCPVRSTRSSTWPTRSSGRIRSPACPRCTSIWTGPATSRGSRRPRAGRSSSDSNGGPRTTAPMYSHDWQAHDVLLWDNASVQHCASGDFPVGEPRRFWRYMVAGPAPLAYGHAT